MKIAIVFDGLGYGGIERVGIDYVTLMLNKGHEVDVYNLNPNQNEMENQMPKNCKMIHQRFPRMFAPEFYCFAIKKWWWGKYAYPIIHCILSIFLFVLRLFVKNRKTQYDVAIAFSGHMNDLNFVGKNFLTTKKKLCWIHGAIYSFSLISSGFIMLYRKIKNIVVLVDDAQDEFLTFNKYLDLNISKLYNPTMIEEKIIDNKKVNYLKETYGKFIIMVARFSYPHKDHYTVVKAIKELKYKYNQDIKILFIGDGPEKNKVEAFCKKENIHKNVIFVGSCEDVQNYYAAAHLLVHASVAGEGLPTIMLESMAFGVPMVVTDSKVGPREILGNDEYGLLCNVKDHKDMAKKVDRLLNDDELYNFYRHQGYKRLADFKPEKIAIKLEKVLKSLK